MNSVPEILMNNGNAIPQFGFGVFQIDPADTAEAVRTAFDSGYRHIDTAQMYGNEKQVGEAIASSGLDRGDLFITSKLNNNAHRPDDARRTFDETLARLGGDYVDLFLVHWPLATVPGLDIVETWNVMQEFYRDGRARSIGVSNFQAHHLRRLHQECEVPPAVNQIEVHPYLTQNELRAFCGEHQIGVEAWSPIAQGAVLDDPIVNEIARRIGKTPAQTVLRWHVELGHIVFPKSVTPERVRENINIFDVELSGADVQAITALDRGQRTGPDPDTFDWVPS